MKINTARFHALNNFLQNPNPARIVASRANSGFCKYIRKSFFLSDLVNFISLRSRITVVFDKLEWDSTEGGDPTREIDRGRKRARKREGLQHKQNVRPSANIYWLNRTHVRCALTKRYLRSYGNLTIDSSKSLNNTLPPFPLYNFCRSNDTFYWREYFAMFFSKPQYINRNYHKIGDGKLFGFENEKLFVFPFQRNFKKLNTRL